MSGGDIVLLITLIVALIVAALYFLNRWATKKMGNQQEMIERTKQSVTIYVIDKKKTKAKDANLPKAVMDNLPKVYRFIKTPLVKAKVGPQIITLMCDKKVFEALPVKKNVKVELAGIYIIGMKGLKSKKEFKADRAKKEELKKESLIKEGSKKDSPVTTKKWYEFYKK